jgi:hypothetical protein
MTIHIILFALYVFFTVNAEKNPSDLVNKLATSCYYLKPKSLCNNQPGCSWCNDASDNDSYSCYETVDDCDCINQSDYYDCVKLSKCHYCNFGEYGGRYCISKNVECVK